MTRYDTLSKIVEQLHRCDFVDREGHSLEMNTAFIALEGMAEAEKEITKSDSIAAELGCSICHGTGKVDDDDNTIMVDCECVSKAKFMEHVNQY